MRAGTLKGPRALELLSVVMGVMGAPWIAACGPPAAAPPAATAQARALLPDVRLAKDRPPVVLVAREGDPTGAIAVAVTTSGVLGQEDDPEIAVALAGVIESRLVARGLSPVVAP